MTLHCFACGKRFRSMTAEARHRHNFPVYCNKNTAAWKRFQAEIADARDQPNSQIHREPTNLGT